MTSTQAPKDTALLPCPYCKSAVRMRRESGVTGKVSRSRFYRERVVCTNENCRASGPVGKSPNSTVARWNRFAAPKTDALDPSTALVQSNRERDQAQGWRTMESAPKDGTRIDIWFGSFRLTDVWWGRPDHTCGEAGRYCDCCPSYDGWCDEYGYLTGEDGREDNEPTHWMLPPSPPVLFSLPPSSNKEEGE